MPSTNMRTTRVKPETSRLLTLHVLRSKQISPHFSRVTLGGGDIAAFVPRGYDQWFRLFLPVAGGSLDRVPNKLDVVSYLRFLTVSRAARPVLRSYSVRAFRPDGPEGPELDVDFVLHGFTDGDSPGPAATWALACRPGDAVGILDEGTGFRLPGDAGHLRIVADETGLPATANILASLPDGITGDVVLEIPDEADRQDLSAPAGVEVTWLARNNHDQPPGRLALAAALDLPVPPEPSRPWFGFTVGEQALASGVRRHWVSGGQPKDRLMFCGYWRAE